MAKGFEGFGEIAKLQAEQEGTEAKAEGREAERPAELSPDTMVDIQAIKMAREDKPDMRAVHKNLAEQGLPPEQLKTVFTGAQEKFKIEFDARGAEIKQGSNEALFKFAEALGTLPAEKLQELRSNPDASAVSKELEKSLPKGDAMELAIASLGVDKGSKLLKEVAPIYEDNADKTNDMTDAFYEMVSAKDLIGDQLMGRDERETAAGDAKIRLASLRPIPANHELEGAAASGFDREALVADKWGNQYDGLPEDMWGGQLTILEKAAGGGAMDFVQKHAEDLAAIAKRRLPDRDKKRVERLAQSAGIEI
ncbi:MAG: hypothetical protein ABIG32_02395 [Candidatus Uhrbacteria bacterium]|nr:hypothetical protein [Patescibacteria group bacterium]